MFGADNEEQQEEWVKKIKFHASLPPSQQLTSYRDFDETKENEFTPPAPVSGVSAPSEPVYANVPTTNNDHSPGATGAVSPPLPETQPPPSYGAAGARQILKQSSRHSLQSQGNFYFSLKFINSNNLCFRSFWSSICQC